MSEDELSQIAQLQTIQAKLYLDIKSLQDENPKLPTTGSYPQIQATAIGMESGFGDFRKGNSSEFCNLTSHNLSHKLSHKSSLNWSE